MQRITPLLLVLVACGQKPKPAAPAEDKPPELDVPDAWIDPADDLPHGIKRTEADRKAALENPNARAIVIRGAKVMTAAGSILDDATVVLEGGAITFVGTGSAPEPEGATVIDGKGKVVTPGIIDAHSHIGVYPAPGTAGHSDGNEATAPVTAAANARYGYWPQDPQITRALAGGVTAMLILPGSANQIGGRAFAVVNKPGRIADDVAFPGAPPSIKMACGENPKRVYGEKGGPSTRMGEYANFRNAFGEAAQYEAKKKAYARAHALWEKKKARAAELDAEQVKKGKKARVKAETAPEPPPVDGKLETLSAVLRGEVLVQIHCYEARDMQQMIDIADEFGFQIRSFHHSLEAYKIRKELVAHGIAINTWADWWGFKMEALDGIPENAGLFTEAGGRVTIHSDSATGIQRLNQEAGKARAYARAAGIEVSEDDALRWITANPAWVMGIDDVTGTLEVGKRADVTIWNGSPFSNYAKAQVVIIAGEVAYDRAQGRAKTDYELENSAEAP